MSHIPTVSSMYFNTVLVPENKDIASPRFCTMSMREHLDHVVSFILRFYYSGSDNSTEYEDALAAYRPYHASRGRVNAGTRNRLEKIQGFDIESVRHTSALMDSVFDTCFSNGDLPYKAYNLLTNAFQSLEYLSKGHPVKGFIESYCGRHLGMNPVSYASRSFLTNGTLVHIVCAKKGLSHLDIRALTTHYALLSFRWRGADITLPFPEVKQIAIVLASTQAIRIAKVSELPFNILESYKADLLRQIQTINPLFVTGDMPHHDNPIIQPDYS